MGDLRRDLDKYHRSLRLKNHFRNDTNAVTEGSSTGPFNETASLKLQSKSTWNPPMGSNNLETIITTVYTPEDLQYISPVPGRPVVSANDSPGGEVNIGLQQLQLFANSCW